jgi:GNAT superfamily N-acetyltransferase
MTHVLARNGTDGVDDAFVELPHMLHASDRHWIPEDGDSVRRAFSRENPWFTTGRAATFCIPGRARLAAFRSNDCRVQGKSAAFFGYFESEAYGPAAPLLLDRAGAWAREQGAEMLYGPIDFDTYGRYRLRTSSERGGGSPFPGEPYNPSRYPEILTDAGFSVAQEYITQIATGVVRPDRAQREALHSVTNAGYTFEELDGARWLALLPELHHSADEIFGEGFAYTPVPAARFAMLYGESVARRLCPHTSVLARSPDGEIAGFFLFFPDYGPLLVQGAAGGRVNANEISFAEHTPRLAAAGSCGVVAKTVGVAPAHRRRGVMDALSAVAIDRGGARYDRWISALVRVGNPSGRFADRLAAERDMAFRTYALYSRPVRSNGTGRLEP